MLCNVMKNRFSAAISALIVPGPSESASFGGPRTKSHVPPAKIQEKFLIAYKVALVPAVETSYT